MFAPKPMKDDGWCVIPGKLLNGKVVDVFNAGAPVSWNEPSSIEKLNKMYHLTLYYMTIHQNKFSYYRKPWAQYICKEWSAAHSKDQQLISFDIDFMERDILPDYQKPFIHRELLISYNCSGSK